MVAPAVTSAGLVVDDGEATRTGDSGSTSLRHQPLACRLAAPLQVRDPDRYELLGEHGRGGLGHVSRAHDKELGRNVAIKELITRGDLGEVRFLREAMITARLEHPGIVPIHEAGRWPDGTPFYVMKLVSGRPLKALIAERTTVEQRIGLLHHVIAVADAVAYAHERKIIHRDLKPANVIAGDFGETIVIDWGLAKDLDTPDDKPIGDGPFRTGARDDLTAAGSILGTPMYMPPEQARGEAVDQRADVFAIGAMLWELCSLEQVPPGDAHQRRHLLRRARIDQDLAAIIAKALAPDPELRYRSAGELAADLKAFKSGARIAARSYSPFAMLARWIRRHRAVAASVLVATAIAITGIALYVRNIAIARDRADQALVRAEAQRVIADTERDNARLSEASALLDKDPTRARDALAALTVRSPQHGLLLSRASQRAASRVLHVPGGIATLRRHPRTSEVVVVANGGELEALDLDRGELRVLDRDLRGAVTSFADGWVYARRPFGARAVTVTTTTTPPRTSAAGALLTGESSSLVSALGRTYALDNGDLYVLDRGEPRLVKRGVRSVVGNDHLLMVCSTTNELEVTRDRTVILRDRCVDHASSWPMAVAGTDYAALVDADTVVRSRGEQLLRLPTHVAGEYELALSGSGLLALADFTGKAWYVAPAGDRFEPGPAHAARPMSVAVDGRLAAWGFTDGAVIVLDTQTAETWEFEGHRFAVTHLAVDERRARLVSVGGDELRIWPLARSTAMPIGALPCSVFNVERSADGARALLDCDDGSARIWTLASGAIRAIHRHDDLAFSVAWMRGLACSGGFDGRVICTAPDGTTRDALASGGRIRRLLASPDHGVLAIASDDGAIRAFDGTLRTLYSHGDVPYALAFSPDGQRLASGASDGSVIVYDLSRRRVRSTTIAHAGLVVSLGWRDRELWTTSVDGTMKHWRDDDGTLALIEGVREPGSFRFLHLFPDGWSGCVDGRVLIVERAGRRLRFELDRHVERVEVSSDDRYVAATTPGEIAIIDLARRAVATLPLASSRVGYVGFVTPGSLTISNAGVLTSVPLSSLRFFDFAPL